MNEHLNKRLHPDLVRDSIRIRIVAADSIRDSIRTKISDSQVKSIVINCNFVPYPQDVLVPIQKFHDHFPQLFFLLGDRQTNQQTKMKTFPR